ncbi:MAG: peptidoglycan-binding protein [Patescibacteria group bacterium]|mgnify:CR=1 FL=1
MFKSIKKFVRESRKTVKVINSVNVLKITRGAFSILIALALLLPTASYILSAAPVLAVAGPLPFNDGFESANFSAWTTSDSKWSISTIEHTGTRSAFAKGDTGSSPDNLSKSISTSDYENINLSYWYRAENLESSDSDTVIVQWSANGGTSWSDPLFTINDDVDDDAWHQKSHLLPAGAEDNADFRFRFRADLDSGSDEVRIDDVSLTGDSMPAPTENSLALCSDSADNDGDSQIDLADSDCAAFTPQLTVTKIVVNDNGGDASVGDFPLFVGETSVASGVSNTFAPGNYTVSETEQEGYSASFSGDCDSEGLVTLAIGDNKECSLTNDDLPAHLTVVKVVVNDNGGDAEVGDFPLFVNENSVSSEEENTVDAGTYTVSETGQSGYAASFGEDCPEGQISLAPGESKTCVITNDDIAPKLTVTKIVINDNGGELSVESFPIFVDEESVNSGEENTFNAGEHAVSESNQEGYTGTFSEDCNQDGFVLLFPGDVKNCVITNDDQPAPEPEIATLIVIKQVINDNGGDMEAEDFIMTVNGTNVSEGSFEGNEEGYSVTLSPGEYSIGEQEMAGYEMTVGEDCSGEIKVNETVTCTITNNDIAPKLIVIKTVINDNGGVLNAEDFNLMVDGNEASPANFAGNSEGVEVSLNAGGYGVSESETAGYTATLSEDCSGSIGIGETKTCEVTNNDVLNEEDNDDEDNVGEEEDNQQEEENPPQENPPANNGGGGGGGGRSGFSENTIEMCSNGVDDDADALADLNDPSCSPFIGQNNNSGNNSSSSGNSEGQVLGESTGTTEPPVGEVLGAAVCTPYIAGYLHYGNNNDPEQVKLLQQFLNQELGLNLPITGIFGPATRDAVKAFQLKYAEQILGPWIPFGHPNLQTPTGYVYKMTLWWINKLWNKTNCPNGEDVPMPELP